MYSTQNKVCSFLKSAFCGLYLFSDVSTRSRIGIFNLVFKPIHKQTRSKNDRMTLHKTLDLIELGRLRLRGGVHSCISGVQSSAIAIIFRLRTLVCTMDGAYNVQYKTDFADVYICWIYIPV